MQELKIAAVVVTYNRKELLLKNLLSLLSQSYPFSKIFIIDNHSTDDTYNFLKHNINFEKISYIYLEENIGGAGGFYTGIKKAYEEGFDWIYAMDDDGRPYDNFTLFKIADFILKNGINSEEKYIINSLVICNSTDLTFRVKKNKKIKDLQVFSKNGIVNNKTQLFNGSLFSKGLIKEIGFPDKNFFIKGDDVEYRMRAVNANATLLTVFDSLYYHPSAPESEISFLLLKYFITIEAPWKEYYTIRNATYTFFKNKKYLQAFIFYFKRRYAVFFLKQSNSKKIKEMMKAGFRDGKRGNLGPKIKP